MKSNNYREELSKEVGVLLHNHRKEVEELVSGYAFYKYISINGMRVGQGLVFYLHHFESSEIYYCEDDDLLINIITEHLSKTE